MRNRPFDVLDEGSAEHPAREDLDDIDSGLHRFSDFRRGGAARQVRDLVQVAQLGHCRIEVRAHDITGATLDRCIGGADGHDRACADTYAGVIREVLDELSRFRRRIGDFNIFDAALNYAFDHFDGVIEALAPYDRNEVVLFDLFQDFILLHKCRSLKIIILMLYTRGYTFEILQKRLTKSFYHLVVLYHENNHNQRCGRACGRLRQHDLQSINSVGLAYDYLTRQPGGNYHQLMLFILIKFEEKKLNFQKHSI